MNFYVLVAMQFSSEWTRERKELVPKQLETVITCETPLDATWDGQLCPENLHPKEHFFHFITMC